MNGPLDPAMLDHLIKGARHEIDCRTPALNGLDRTGIGTVAVYTGLRMAAEMLMLTADMTVEERVTVAAALAQAAETLIEETR